MSHRSPHESIALARLLFDADRHRAAFDSLLELARREPATVAYREALADLYRRAGSLDQAARWAAHDPSSLDSRETRALERSLQQFDTEAGVRRYLHLRGDLPDIATAHLRVPRHPRHPLLAVADRLDAAASFIGGALGISVIVLGLVATFVLTLEADPNARTAARMAIVGVLAVVSTTFALRTASSLMRRYWIRAGLFAGVLIAATVLLVRLPPFS